jgi:hypothetical protein
MKTFNALLAAAMIAAVYSTAEAEAAPKEVVNELSAPQLQGKHTARFWGFRLFNAELWTSKPGKFSFDQQFALTLRYLYPFSREVLARSSVEEIARVEGGLPEKFAKLESQLKKCLVDVDKGTRITGVAESSNKVAMYVNGRKSCTISYPNLREQFFGIWLSPTSRDARGAQRLRGAS